MLLSHEICTTRVFLAIHHARHFGDGYNFGKMADDFDDGTVVASTEVPMTMSGFQFQRFLESQSPMCAREDGETSLQPRRSPRLAGFNFIELRSYKRRAGGKAESESGPADEE